MRHPGTILIAAVAVVVGLTAMPSPAAAALDPGVGHLVIDPLPGDTWTEAVDTSGSRVVGTSGGGTRPAHAFAIDLRYPGPRLRDLGTLGGESRPTALDGLLAVGWSVTPAGTD